MPAAAKPRLQIDRLHAAGGIARTRCRALRNRRRNALDLGRGELDVRGTGIFIEAANVARTGNGDDVGALRQQPGERQLGERAPLCGGDGLDAADKLAIVVEVFGLEAGMLRAPAIDIRELSDGTGEKPAAEGRVGCP